MLTPNTRARFALPAVNYAIGFEAPWNKCDSTLQNAAMLHNGEIRKKYETEQDRLRIKTLATFTIGEGERANVLVTFHNPNRSDDPAFDIKNTLK
jgi:hypothetical protein